MYTPTETEERDESEAHFTSDETRLFELAQRIKGWQSRRRLSDTRMIRAYPALGSTKTYAKLVKGDAAQLKIEDWLSKYEGIARLIEAQAESESVEPVYDDLGTTAAVLEMGTALLGQSAINRISFVEGDSGSGKTKALVALRDRNPGMVFIAEATESWDSKNEMVGELLVSIGEVADVKALPTDFGTRQRRLIGALRSRRIILCIDEGHHMTGKGLNVIKTLDNQTACAFIIAGQNTLWRKLQAASWQEAKQLRHNRCFSNIVFGSPSRIDAELFVSRKAGKIDKLKEETWKSLIEHAAHFGGFAFLRDVVAQALTQIPEGDSLDDATLLSAAESIKARAGGK